MKYKSIFSLLMVLIICGCSSFEAKRQKTFESYDMNEETPNNINIYVQAQNAYDSSAMGAQLFDPGAEDQSSHGKESNQVDLKSHKSQFGKVEWPIKQARFIRGFDPKTNSKDRHFGLDLAAPKGTSVFAAKEGRVIYAGAGFTGFGKIVIIEHLGGKYATFYSHLSEIDVSEGEAVSGSDLIGKVGSTGRSTGNHLHFEIRSIQDGPLDPLEFLK